MKLRTLIAATFCIASFGTGFAMAATPESAAINVPAGWTPASISMNVGSATSLGFWYAPASDKKGDNLNLGFGEMPTPVALSDVVAQMNSMYAKFAGAGNVVASHAEKVCNGTADGWFFENYLNVGTLMMDSEQTVLLGTTRTFFATYTRMKGESEDKQARQAIDSLCVKASGSQTT